MPMGKDQGKNQEEKAHFLVRPPSQDKKAYKVFYQWLDKSDAS